MGKQDQLKFVREVISEVREKSDTYLREADEDPMRVAVTVGWNLVRMLRIGATPETFTDKEEKEKVILLWRKLQNILARCQDQLTEEQKTRAQTAVDAGNKLDFYQDISLKLDAYLTYQRLGKEIMEGEKKNLVLTLVQICSFVILTCLGIGIYDRFKYAMTEKNALQMLLGIYPLIFALFIGLIIPATKKSKTLPAQKENRKRAAKTGCVKDDKYWALVQKEFGGLPSPDELKTRVDACIAILDPIFHVERIEEPSEAQT